MLRMNTSDKIKEKHPEWLVPNFIECRGTTLLYGTSGTGKGFWLLGQVIVPLLETEYRVVYCAIEDYGFILARMHGYCKYYNKPFHIMRPRLMLNEGGYMNLLKESEIVGHIKLWKDFRPDLVILDPLRRIIGGAEENSAGIASQVYDACDRFKDALGCSVLLVHHTGKDRLINGQEQRSRKSRGSAAWRDLSDTELYLRRQGKDQMILELSKQRKDNDSKHIGYTRKHIDYTDRGMIVVVPDEQVTPLKSRGNKDSRQLLIYEDSFNWKEFYLSRAGIISLVKEKYSATDRTIDRDLDALVEEEKLLRDGNGYINSMRVNDYFKWKEAQLENGLTDKR